MPVAARAIADPVAAIRAGSGLVDLARPADVGALELGFVPDRREQTVYRVLGARQIVQAVVVARTGWTAAGAVVDLLHAGSMVALAVASPRYRRGALVQAAVGTAFALSGLLR